MNECIKTKRIISNFEDLIEILFSVQMLSYISNRKKKTTQHGLVPSGSQTRACISISPGLVKTQSAGPHPQEFIEWLLSAD